MIITSRKPENKHLLYGYLKEKKVLECWSDDFQGFGVLNTELALKAVVGYNSFCRRTCSMHVAGEGNWITRELLFVSFDYPFRQLDVVQIFVSAAASNERALKLQSRLGFKPLVIIPRGWDESTDLVVQTMTKEACEWLKGNYEQAA